MKYLSFEIENFKGIQNLVFNMDLQTPSNIFPIIGLNESGKTTILEAINTLDSDINGSKIHELRPKHNSNRFTGNIVIRANLFFENDDLDEILNLLEEKCKIELIEGGDNSYDKLKKGWSIERIFGFEQGEYKGDNFVYKIPDIWYKTKKEDGTDNIVTLTSEQKNVVEGYICNKRPKIIYYPNFSNQIPDKIYLRKDSNLNINDKTNSLFRSVIGDILNYYHEGETIESCIIAALNRENIEQSEADVDNIKSELEISLTKDIIDIWNVFSPTDTMNWRIDIKIGKENIGGIDEPYMSFKVIQGPDTYKISERSLGFRWFFSFILLTQFRKKRLDDTGKYLFLIDEPASNLHQNAQNKILTTLFTKIADENISIIYSTHSASLINPRYILSTYIIVNDAVNYKDNGDMHRITNIHAYLYKTYVGMNGADPTHYQPLKDAIDYYPDFLEISDGVIFLEGKSDYYAFSIMSKTLGFEFKFYPGASVTKFESVFRREIAEGRKFIAIFDSDEAGEKNKEKYLRDIGIMLKNNIFTYKDIQSNRDNYEIESLFSEEDKNKLMDLVEDSGMENKKRFLLGLEFLFASDSIQIIFSEETTNNFRCIFNYITEKMEILNGELDDEK